MPWRAIGSIGAGTALIAWHAVAYGNWVVDDAGITFDYARGIATGLGPVLQTGAAPVEGYSNPSWLMLLVVGRWLGLFDHGTIFGIPDYILYPKALALLCCCGIVGACHAAAAAVTRRAWLITLAVGATLAVIPSFVIWCFSGLENSLYALVVVLLAVVMFRAVLGGKLLTPRIAIGVGLLAALAALTRPDGIIYAAGYPLVGILLATRPTLGRTIRLAMVAVAAFLVPFGSYLVFRYLEFGRLVPNTAVAKGQPPPAFDYLNRAQQLTDYAGWAAVLMAAVCVGVAVVRRSRFRVGVVALLVPLGLAIIAFCLLSPDWMPQFRFATPVWPLAALVAALAVAEVLASVRLRVRVLVSLALVVASALSITQFFNDIKEFRAAPTVPLCWIADRYGRAINGYADYLEPENPSLLVPDLGGTAMTSRFQLIDLAGLADRQIADFYADNDMTGLRNYVFEDVKPTIIHFHDVWGTMTGLVSDPRLTSDYYQIIEGDYVRGDAVAGPTQLARLRAYAAVAVPAVEGEYQNALRRSCGPTLHAGQTG